MRLSLAPLLAIGVVAGCASDNGGLKLPPGFRATVFADEVGVARHLLVGQNGDVYVALNNAFSNSTSHIGRRRPDHGRPGIVALRDTNADGRADVESRIEAPVNTGIVLHENWLYVSARESILRYRFDASRLGVAGNPDTVVTGFPEGGGHDAKSLTVNDSGDLLVGVGSYGNACRSNRTEAAPDPCPQLTTRAGIWRYRLDRLNQRHPADGERWATGVRNAQGLAWSREYRGLYATSHGRDGLAVLWPRLFTVEKNAETPSEELMRVERGADFGWPYCYHDRQLGAKVDAPEYGGDGTKADRCRSAAEPLIGLPAHWGPNALAFYTATSFPARYRGGAFIAFHGSWNRMPLPEQGYNVVFVPFASGRPTGTFEVFADGFTGELEPIRAEHRPSGLAVGPDGALYVTDDQRGRIWRITYVGQAR